MLALGRPPVRTSACRSRAVGDVLRRKLIPPQLETCLHRPLTDIFVAFRMQALRTFRTQWRALRQSSRDYMHKRPTLQWTLSALDWLPLGLFVTEYAFNIKAVKGRSMQVRHAPSHVGGRSDGGMAASLRLTRTTRRGGTSCSSTGSRSRCGTSSGAGTSLRSSTFSHVLHPSLRLHIRVVDLRVRQVADGFQACRETHHRARRRRRTC